MAENTFRSFRNRDSAAPGGSDAASFGDASDPLAELARLIGQTGADRDARTDTARSAATASTNPPTRNGKMSSATPRRTSRRKQFRLRPALR